MSNIEFAVLGILKHYRADARIQRGEILKQLRGRGYLVDDRKLRKTIEELRTTEAGSMICSSLKGGYYLAQNDAELIDALASDEHRFITGLQRCRLQRKAAKLAFNPALKAEIESQLAMFYGGEAQEIEAVFECDHGDMIKAAIIDNGRLRFAWVCKVGKCKQVKIESPFSHGQRVGVKEIADAGFVLM